MHTAAEGRHRGQAASLCHCSTKGEQQSPSLKLQDIALPYKGFHPRRTLRGVAQHGGGAAPCREPWVPNPTEDLGGNPELDEEEVPPYVCRAGSLPFGKGKGVSWCDR